MVRVVEGCVGDEGCGEVRVEDSCGEVNVVVGCVGREGCGGLCWR